MKTFGVVILICMFICCEAIYALTYYFPYMDYDGIEIIYAVALVCRILIYTLILVGWDKFFDKFLTYKKK